MKKTNLNKLMQKKIERLFIFGVLLLVLQSCYTFRGASLDPSLKTIQIQNFKSEAAGGPSNMTINLTQKMREYFQSNSSLKIASKSPDILIDGAITGYEMTPQAPTSSDKPGVNRLTIRVNIKLVNSQKEDKNFDQEFSFYKDFSQEKTLSAVEPTIVPLILDQIVLDVFNKTAGEW